MSKGTLAQLSVSRGVALTSIAAVALAASGCFSKSNDETPPFLTASQVEEGSRAIIADKNGVSVSDIGRVRCPGNLTGKEGTTMTCSLKTDGKRFNVLVRVTSVDGLRINYEIESTLAS